MPYVPLKRFLFRAALLPVRALRDGGGPTRLLATNPLGAAALQLASPDLANAFAGGRSDARARAAVARYARRAAFRPTPNGFWAGVGVGALSARTRARTGSPSGQLSPSWQSLAALGRALLEDADVRPRTRLRHAPSLVVGARGLLWLASDGPDAGQDDFCQERRAHRDDALTALIEACGAWTPWETVRATVATAVAADPGEDLDEWLLTLIDDGLLHTDVVPPLVGPEPGAWMAARLARIPEARALAEDFARFRTIARGGDVAGATAALTALLPKQRERGRETSTPTPLRGTLVFTQGAAISLSQAAVERATALAPLLFRLQEAMVPPSSERTPGVTLGEALESATEIFGAGALDLGALALGGYGSSPGDDDADGAAPPPGPAPSPALLTFLMDAVAQAARENQPEVRLRAQDLEPLLDDTALPPTAELFVTPGRARPGAAAGQGWLLGLHAPAGASWGRFAAALGDAGRPLFDDLREAEIRARPDEQALDVVFAPSARLADLCTHPPLRPHALALSGWPAEILHDDGQPGEGHHPITLGELELVADPSALEPLALRAAGVGPVAPTPLHRVRSTTAPAGLWQTLVGWSLRRQHAPWALSWGTLANLAVLPRVAIDGFVVAPASWRVPEDLRAGTGSARALAAWRRDRGIPRHVQVGAEDELLPVDLTRPEARADLKGHARAFEIWPPLEDTPDESGRRIEAVVGIVQVPDGEERAFISAATSATAAAGRVPPPMSDAVLDDAWRTFKLFGATDRQDLVLAEIVGPAIATAREAGEISGWFFQRYVEGPGRRPHLRLRVARANDDAAFERRLGSLFASTSAPGDIVALDTAPYFPEIARFGGPATLPAVHKLFEASSDLVLAQLDRETEAEPDDDQLEDQFEDQLDDRLITLVSAYDVLGAAFGLDAQARQAVAERRRQAHTAAEEPAFGRELAREFRAYRTALRTALASRGKRGPVPSYGTAARAAAASLDEATKVRLLPVLLHLDAVRLMGTDRVAEIRALTFWERTLESLERHPEPAA